MAASVAHSPFGLHAPALDDTMELSSDLGQVDADIDIDFDQDEPQGQYIEDYQMLDDAKSDFGTMASVDAYQEPANDDDMIDDDVSPHVDERDGIMRDDLVPQEHDEELLDFSDDEEIHDATAQNQEPHYIDNAAAIRVPEIAIQEPTESQLHFDQIGAVQSYEAANVPENERSSTAVDTNADTIDDTYLFDRGVSVSLSEIFEEEGEQAQASNEAVLEVQNHDGPQRPSTTAQHVDKDSAEAPLLPSLEQLPVQSDAAPDAEPQHSGENELAEVAARDPEERSLNEEIHDGLDVKGDSGGTSTRTGLHPTIVVYEGSEVSLFPSGDPLSTEQYFLEDENLVNASIGDLLLACRTVLGSSISQDDELELGVDDLGLYVSEVCLNEPLSK